MNKNKVSIYLLIGILLICTTSTTSYAFFTSSLSLENFMLGSTSISNGGIELEFSDDGSAWTEMGSGTPIGIDGSGNYNGVYNISSENESISMQYGPVKILKGATNLHSNIDFKMDFNVGENVIVNNEFAQPFEVIVGDMDNFGTVGEHFDTQGIDPYTGFTTKDHSIDIFPDKYDAMGTDRRMVPSGFYDMINSYTSYEDNKNSALNKINKSINYYRSDNIAPVETNAQYYSLQLLNNISYNNKELKEGMTIMFEGYTERALKGTDSSRNPITSDKTMDGKDWRYIQAAEPITFKYEKGDGSIKSAVFQLFLDDLQPGKSVGTIGKEFVSYSSSEFKVYLIAGDKKVEVSEFSKTINSFNQSGPKGNILTFSLPKRYFYLLDEANGLENGLQLLIDDNRFGTTGDSFVIDFAKLTVNEPVAVASKINVSGKVLDEYGNPKANVKVLAGDGNETITDNNGNFYLYMAPGIINLIFEAEDYEDALYVSENTTTNLSNITIQMKKYEQKDALEITLLIKEIPEEKYTIKSDSYLVVKEDQKEFIKEIQEQYKDGYKLTRIVFNPLKDINKNFSVRYQDFQVNPTSYYEISYILRFSSQEEMNYYKQKHIEFNSAISVRATQENNPGWDESGTDLEGLGAEKNVYNLARSYNDNGNSTIYFEKPTTQNYWSNSVPIFYVNNMEIRDGHKQLISNNKWWVYNRGNQDPLDRINGNNGGSIFSIEVKDGGDSTKGSGRLYYFNTRKIFVCTN